MIVLISAANFEAKVKRIAAVDIEPVVVEAQSQLTIDGKGFAIKRTAAGLHTPTGGIERLAAVPLKIDKRKSVAALDPSKAHIVLRVVLKVEFAKPTESGGHDEVARESLRVGEDDTSSAVGTELCTRKFIGEQSAVVAATEIGPVVAPPGEVEGLGRSEVLVNRDTHVRLLGGQIAELLSQIVVQRRKVTAVCILFKSFIFI